MFKRQKKEWKIIIGTKKQQIENNYKLDRC